MYIDFNFNLMGVNSSIEVCFFYKTIEKSEPKKKRIRDKKYFRAIKKLKENTEYNYYFIYSYELDISESKEKNYIHD